MKSVFQNTSLFSFFSYRFASQIFSCVSLWTDFSPGNIHGGGSQFQAQWTRGRLGKWTGHSITKPQPVTLAPPDRFLAWGLTLCLRAKQNLEEILLGLQSPSLGCGGEKVGKGFLKLTNAHLFFSAFPKHRAPVLPWCHSWGYLGHWCESLRV